MKLRQRVYISVRENPGNNYKVYFEDANNCSFHFASFTDYVQFYRFSKRFKLKYEVNETCCNVLLQCNKVFENGPLFWKRTELPKGVKKIKALSNGSIVDCYYKETKTKIIFYRPNPNAKNVYKPLGLEEHIAFQKTYGIY